jgi:hypothetical protein
METAAPKCYWSRQSGLARAAQMWSWCPRMNTRRLPRRHQVMMS